MALLEKVNPNDYTLGSAFSVNGRIFLCSPKDIGQELCIAKKISTKSNSFTDIRESCNKLKSSLLQSIYIVLPDSIWEDKKENQVYVLSQKMVKSVQEILQEHRRKGKLIPIALMKRIVNDSSQGLKKVHSQKLSHGHLKPGNIMLNDKDDFNLCDFGKLSQEEDQEYMSPEEISMLKASRIGNSSMDPIGDAQKHDLFGLGMTFLVIATLKKPNDLLFFRNTLANPDPVKAIRTRIEQTYGTAFAKILDGLLQNSPVKRKKISELQDAFNEFADQVEKDLDEAYLEPDTGIIIDEMKSRLIGKKETLQDYFKKYEMQGSQIYTISFFQGLEDLGLQLSNYEKAALEKFLDPKDSGHIDLYKMIRQESTIGIKMGSLKPPEQKSLQELLSEMASYLNENRIDLFQLMTSADKTGKHYLNEKDFNEILTDCGLGLTKDDLHLCKLRFDPEKKGNIYYDFFCDEINASVLGSNEGIDQIINQIYTVIRDHFQTFDTFFKKYNTSSRGFLKDSEFAQFLNDYDIHPSTPVMKDLTEQLDPKNKKQLLYDDIRRAFQKLVNNELLCILNQILLRLDEEDTYFIPLCKKFTKSQRVIPVDQLFDALRSINTQIKRPDLQFLLTNIGADHSVSLEFMELIVPLQKVSKQLGIKKSVRFGDLPAKKASNFDDDDDEKPSQRDEDHRQGNKAFEGCKSLLLAIMKALDTKKRGPSSFFPNIMERQEMREKMRDLQVNQSDYEDEWDELMDALMVNKNKIDGPLLAKALIEVQRGIIKAPAKSSATTKTKPTTYLMQNAAVQSFQIMTRAMKRKEIHGDLFSDQDHNATGVLQLTGFNNICDKDLDIDIDTPLHKKLIIFLADPEDPKYINLKSLMTGLKEEDLAEQFLQDVNIEMMTLQSESKQKTDRIFNKFDRNHNGQLDEQEFLDLVKELVPDVFEKRIAQVLFMKIDSSGDSQISMQEFKSKITGEPLERKNIDRSQVNKNSQVNKKVSKDYMKAAGEIVQALQREGLDRQIFDRRESGQCALKFFNDQISELGLELTKPLKSLIQVCMSTKDSNMIDSQKLLEILDEADEASELLKIVVEWIQQNPQLNISDLFKDHDSNENGGLQLREFQTLIREIDSNARQKSIESLFAMMDSNADGEIQIQELKQKVMGKNTMSASIRLQQSQTQSTRFDKNQDKHKHPDKQPQIQPTRFDKNQDKHKHSDKQSDIPSQSDVIDFIVKSTYLPEALEKLDTNQINSLSLEQVVQAFDTAYGPPGITLECIKAIATELGALQAGNVNYKAMVKAAKDQYGMKKTTGASKLHKVCDRVKQDLGFKGVDLIEICLAYDRNKSGRVNPSVLVSELEERKVRISKDDMELLVSQVQVDEKGLIDYQELNVLITYGPESKEVKFQQSPEKKKKKRNNSSSEEDEKKMKKSKKKRNNSSSGEDEKKMKKSNMKVSRVLVEESFEQFIQQCIAYMDKMNYSVRALFRKCDKSGDNQISFLEFHKNLLPTIDLKYDSEEIAERVFTKIDKDGDERISLDEFEKAILLDNVVTPNQIQHMKENMMGGMRATDKEIRLVFENITNGKEFTFQQFSKFIRTTDHDTTALEIDQLFRHFDRDEREKVNMQTFAMVMNETNKSQNQLINNRIPFGKNLNVQYSDDQIDQKNTRPQLVNTKQNLLRKNLNDQYSDDQIDQKNTRPQLVNTKRNLLGKNIIKTHSEYLDIKKGQGVIPPTHEETQFSQSHYEGLLRQRSIECKTELFDIFCLYDLTEKPDFTIGSVMDLQRIFDFFSIKAPQSHTTQLFFYYSQQGSDQMPFIELCLRCGMGKGKLIGKALNFTMAKHVNYTVQFLWNNIGQNKNTWSIEQFRIIEKKLELGLSQQELDEAFSDWDQKGTGQITFQQYSMILKQCLVANKINAPPKAIAVETPQEQLQQFLAELAGFVHSKGCFNLYENCDPQQTNQISVQDFERTTKQIFSDLSPQHMVLVRQLMANQGYIDLSELADALQKNQNDPNDKFNVGEEKRQFGIGEIGKRRAGPLPTQQEFQSLMLIIQEFLKKKQKTFDDLGYYYFPQGGASTIEGPLFITRTMEASMGLGSRQAQQLFEYLDVNANGAISINEFRIVFMQTKTVQRNIENVQVSKEIEDEIRELFEKIDLNKNNHLDRHELKKALMNVGLNPSEVELERYFQTFDKNNNGVLQFEEFSTIMKDMLKKEMLSAQDLLEELRKEFRLVCNPSTRCLSKDQVKQVFANMGVGVREDELDSLFNEIDQDRSGTIDIDEYIYFIQKNQSGLSAKASAAVMNIKGARRISLHDLREIFTAMPQNFIISFILTQNKRTQQLPSSALKPKIDPSGFYFQDLQYVDASNLNIKKSVLETINVKNNVCFEIRLLEATGVPIPEEKEVPRQSCIGREVGLLFWDRAKQRFEGNSVFVAAQWDPNYEDRWRFDMPGSDNSVLLRWGSYDDRLDSSIDLVLEMITYYNRKGQLFHVNCSYASIQIQQLMPGKQWVELRGGAPSKDIIIHKDDIRTNRTGWRSVVKSLSSTIKSQILIEITKIQQPQLIQQIQVLPNRCILNKGALSLWRGFREYFAYRTMQRGEIEISLVSEPRMRAWLNLIDCPDSYKSFQNLWNDFIEPKCKTHQFILDAAQVIGDQAYLMFVSSDFKFNSGDPTKRVNLDNILVKKRQEIINETISEIKFILQLGQQSNMKVKKTQMHQNMDPLNIQESMEQEDEDEMANIERFLQKQFKKQKKQ